MYRQLHICSLLVYGLIIVRCDQRQDNCVQEGLKLTCQHLPTQSFSHSVQHVYTEGTNIETDMITFDPATWFNVTKLEMQAEDGEFFGNNNGSVFQGLTHLERLGIHARKLTYFNRQTFLGLLNLKCLDLSYCYRLTVEELIKPLMDITVLASLEFLDLTALSNFYFKSFSLTSKFFEVLSWRPIKYLNFSHISVTEADLKGFERLCQSLEILNLSNVIYIPKQGTFSGSETLLTCLSLQVIDWSHLSIGNVLYWLTDRNRSHSIVEVVTNFEEVVPSVHTVIINNVNFGIPEFWIRVNGDNYSCSRCGFGNVKTLSVKGNKLKWLNASLINADTVTVTVIDLSDNGLEFLSPSFLKELVYLEVLVFRNNMLHVMQQYPDFEDLFATLKNLRTVDLSENGLTRIPKYMFVENKNLRVIHLFGNKLESISFVVDGLDKLQTLDLRRNRISLLSGADFVRVSYFVRTRFTNYSNFNIDVHENPFVCNCESSQFIRWLYIYLTPKLTKYNRYMCVFNTERVELDEKIMAESQNLCLRRSVIFSTSALSCIFFLTVLVLSLLLIKSYKRKKREKLREEFIGRLRNENFDNKRLVFIMYCQKDEEFVVQHVTEQIASCLKKLLKTDHDIIWDFTSYRLGLTLISEAERCLRQSFVVVLLISRAFCECLRCNRELKLALNKDKPIAIIYKETIGIEKVSPLLETISKNCLKASFLQKQNDLVLTPSVARFCTSVLDLAAASDKGQDSNI